MYGVFALAEPDGLSRLASPSVWPSVLSQHVGAPSLCLSRVITRPAHAPVNASLGQLLVPVHDSGASVVRYTFTA
jgi:hypothetical protein